MKIFCGNLNFQTTAEGLRAAFEPFGEVVEAKIVNYPDTDRSRGFGFVEMPNQEEALKAFSALDGMTLDGRVIHLEEARPRVKRDRPYEKRPEDSIWR